MPFVVTECDSREIPFFHHDRAFRRFNSHHTSTTSVDQGLDGRAYTSAGRTAPVGGGPGRRRFSAASSVWPDAASSGARRSDAAPEPMLCASLTMASRKAGGIARQVGLQRSLCRSSRSSASCDNPRPAVEQVADHPEFGALGGDVCQCLLGVAGSACRAQGGHQQPVGLQQRARAGLGWSLCTQAWARSQARPG